MVVLACFSVIRHSDAQNEENHEKPSQNKPVTRQRLKPGTSRIQRPRYCAKNMSLLVYLTTLFHDLEVGCRDLS